MVYEIIWSLAVPLPVPVQSPLVVPIEEVGFGAHGSHLWVHPNKFQHCPGATFFNPYDDGLGEPLVPVAEGSGAVGRGVSVVLAGFWRGARYLGGFSMVPASPLSVR